MLLGHLRTHVIEDHSNFVPEGGFFESTLYLQIKMIEQSGAPRAFTMKHIGMCLAESVMSTGVPPALWTFAPSPRLRRMFDLPELLEFNQ